MEDETESPETITELTDRELQEKILEVLEKQERHQKFFSNVISVSIAIQVLAALYLVSILLKY